MNGVVNAEPAVAYLLLRPKGLRQVGVEGLKVMILHRDGVVSLREHTEVFRQVDHLQPGFALLVQVKVAPTFLARALKITGYSPGSEVVAADALVGDANDAGSDHVDVILVADDDLDDPQTGSPLAFLQAMGHRNLNIHLPVARKEDVGDEFTVALLEMDFGKKAG